MKGVKQRGIDAMKHRKHTHLAGVDVDIIVAEQGQCVLTIKDAYYQEAINVSGTATDAYVLEFHEDVKPMVVNSTNRKTISKIAKSFKSLSDLESRNIANWIGLQIELVFDQDVKFGKERVGGIVVKYKLPPNPASDVEALEKLSQCKTQEDLRRAWESLSFDEKKLPTVLAVKDQLKSDLK